ncbi:MAG: hypothetical protein K6G15_05495 [Desulfovibrio sp.]|nr:hypothetical protein [Desulfovibrio sp.]
MAIHLSDHFSYSRLLAFTLPSVVMMLFTSIYVVVDGFFVANYTGKNGLAAITLIFPLLGVLGAAGFMLGSGGAAIVGKMLGEKQKALAQSTFSFFVAVTAVSGLLLSLLGQCLLEPVAKLLGARDEILSASLLYGRITLLSLPAFMLQFFFQPFFVTSEKPKLGLWVTVIAGLSNMLLDALLVAVLDFGLVGAALATAVSELLGGLLPIGYFLRKNTSLLALCRFQVHLPRLLAACGNGLSEFLINVAYPLLMAVYNAQLLRISDENGVAAFGVLLYISYVFIALFLGYAIGCAPLVSYNLGAGRPKELHNLLRKSLCINAVTGLILTLLAFFAARPLAEIFTGYDRELTDLSSRALMLYAPVFLLAWVNIYGSSFFTALNNGLASALIACLRTLVFGLAAILILPIFLGLDGVWISWSCGELATLLVTVWLFRRQLRCQDWH